MNHIDKALTAELSAPVFQTWNPVIEPETSTVIAGTMAGTRTRGLPAAASCACLQQAVRACSKLCVPAASCACLQQVVRACSKLCLQQVFLAAAARLLEAGHGKSFAMPICEAATC